MIVNEDLLKKIRAAFDLNIYEAKIWTALLGRGLATAGELSDISQIPRSRSYDVLESLEKKGFVMMKLGKPIKYIAIEPEEILHRMKEQVKEKSKTRIASLESIKGDMLFGELELLYNQGIQKVDPTSLSGSFKGRDSIYTQLKSMLENAKKEVVFVTTADGLARKTKKFRNVFSKLKKRGVNVKVAAPLGSIDQTQLKEIKDYAQVKHLNQLDARFCIVDNEQVLFMVSDDSNVHESYDTAVWVNTPFFSQAFTSMFKNVWNELPQKP